MTWTFGHPHDFFIAGIIVGVLFSMWVAVVVALFVQTRRDGPGQASIRNGMGRRQAVSLTGVEVDTRPQEGPQQ